MESKENRESKEKKEKKDSIEKIDKNFTIKSADENGIVWYDCTEEPFSIHGLMYDDGGFVRMPRATAENVNEGVFFLNTQTAGGRVCFRTDSPAVSIRAELVNISKMSHFALTGSTGFDMYAGVRHAASFIPPFDIEKGYSATAWLPFRGINDITINFPLYSGVKKLEIGLMQGFRLLPEREYKYKKPVVYYGSSITQGGCASRPGCSYQSMLSRRLDCDYINLGFSGSAKGEIKMAEYIAGLEMSVFVYDYDHNAPDADHLESTHERMFRIIRDKHPELPVIMMTRPDSYLDDNTLRCRSIIMRTYTNAIAAGDRKVYFIDGRSFVKDGDSTVDGTHPNDIGFLRMADALENILRGALAGRDIAL